MLRKLHGYFSLKERRLRRIAELAKGTDTQERLKELIGKIKPSMLLNFKHLEQELVAHGSFNMDSHGLSLDKDSRMFKKISRLELTEDESTINFLDKVYLKMERKANGKFRISEVSASCKYLKSVVVPLLDERGIEMECVNANVEWYVVKFTIEGVN